MSGKYRYLVAALLVIALLVGGSLLSGRSDDGSGFRDFFDRVEDTGLDVEWTNIGLRGGDGTIETECGPREISLALFAQDDTLNVVSPVPVLLTPESAQQLLRCEI